MPESVSATKPASIYEGHSSFLLVVPWMLVVVALTLVVTGVPVVAFAFGVMCLVVSSLLPWRFAVSREGVLLTFVFGADRFFSRHDVVVQLDEGGAVLLPTPSARRGYLLVDGVLGSRRMQLRGALRSAGFRFV